MQIGYAVHSVSSPHGDARPAQRVLFLYLQTGAGHLGPCRSIAAAMETLAPGTETLLVNAIDPAERGRRRLIENGYRVSASTLPFLWTLMYELSMARAVMTWNQESSDRFTRRYLRRVIAEFRPTRIVNAHSLLTVPLQRAQRDLGTRIPAWTLVTDPFSVHPFWFHRSRTATIVMSPGIQAVADRVKDFHAPLLVRAPVIQPRFEREPDPADIRAFREREGFRPDRKLVLIAGGGEGIFGGERFLHAILESGADCDVALVAGRNELLKLQSRLILKLPHIRPKLEGRTVRIYGFVDFMYELLHASDLVLTKGGASTIWEIMLSARPAIVCQFIHGQELGNVQFVVKSGSGFYEPSPHRVGKLVRTLVEDPPRLEGLSRHIRALGLRNGAQWVAQTILDGRLSDREPRSSAARAEP